jgi:hypothetical protein
MNIAKQHSEFKIRANRIDSNHYKDLLPYQIDSLLNEGADFIVEHYGELRTFNITQFNKDLFGSLLVMFPDQPALLPSATQGQQYEYLLSNLKYDYAHLDRAYVQCGNLVVPVSLFRGDEQHKLNDAYQKPSFLWKRLLGKIGKSSTENGTSLYVYSDVDLNNKELRVEYVKKPKRVFFGSYDSVEYLDCQRLNHLPNVPVMVDCNIYYKSTDYPVSSDLPESLHGLQVDIATWLFTGKTENQFLNSFITNKISNLPK